MWRKNPESRDYDYRLINERVRLIRTMRQRGDVYGLINALRTGLVRNLGNITSRKLFNGSFSGTKLLIEEYIAQYVEGILDLAALPPPIDGEEASLPQEWEDGEISAQNGGVEEDVDESNPGTAADLRDRPCAGGMATATISTQHKLDFIHNAKQGFGRSALVLQGGAIFGLCHLGVVKALFLRGLLPRVIIGTATGAMMAALVGVHPEEDLLRILTGDGIDLSAFAGKGADPASHNRRVGQSMWTRLGTLRRRVQRFRKEGYFLDVKVLEECVRANVGDLTFDEAFNRSKRILNITVVTAGQEGIPTLLNYVTAPNVVCPPPTIPPLPSNTYQPTTTDRLDSRGSLQRLLVNLLRRADQDPLQRRARQHHALGADRHGRLPALDVGALLGPQRAAAARARPLQREPLHRQPGAPLPGALFAVGHARPRGGGRRPARPAGHDARLAHAHARARDAPPPAPARRAAPAARVHPPLPRRRAGPRREPHAGARGGVARLCAAAGDADARDARVLDGPRGAERVAGGGGAAGEVCD